MMEEDNSRDKVMRIHLNLEHNKQMITEVQLDGDCSRTWL
jgi:hypothetical protein